MADKFDDTLLVDALLSGFGSPTLLCDLGSRMFFNLKEAAEHSVNVGTNWSSYSHSAIRFDGAQISEAHPKYVTGTCLVLEAFETDEPLFSGRLRSSMEKCRLEPPSMSDFTFQC